MGAHLSSWREVRSSNCGWLDQDSAVCEQSQTRGIEQRDFAGENQGLHAIHIASTLESGERVPIFLCAVIVAAKINKIIINK